VNKKNLLYEGKAKKIYKTDNENEVLVEFKDSATAFDGKKKGKIQKKGFYNCQISSNLFKYLESYNVNTHFIENVSENSMLAKKLKMIPVEVVIRNIAAGSLSKRFGIKEGTEMPIPIAEYYLKNDELHDPMLNEYHIRAMELADKTDLAEMTQIAFKINALLKDFFLRRKIRLVDFKLEFGKFENELVLGDEITPDSCRFWEVETNKKLDKDRFRFDLGKVEEAYKLIYKKVSNIEDEEIPEDIIS